MGEILAPVKDSGTYSIIKCNLEQEGGAASSEPNYLNVDTMFFPDRVASYRENITTQGETLNKQGGRDSRNVMQSIACTDVNVSLMNRCTA
jgi:hypothetical protein